MDIEYPVVAYPLADRIAGAVTAYACGDALGLTWEQFPPAGASAAEIEAWPAREGWERGATSDDTALTLLVAQHLADRSGAVDAREFLQTLAAQAGSIRGLGPSTTGAIKHFRVTGELPISGGTTNGAPMRALPVGWATPLDDPDRHRRLTIELTRATHPDPDALAAACVVAACASWALEGASGQLLLDVAIEEETRARSACGASDRRHRHGRGDQRWAAGCPAGRHGRSRRTALACGGSAARRGARHSDVRRARGRARIGKVMR